MGERNAFEPETENLQGITVVPINCIGENGGIAEANVSGSTSDYSYQWYYQTGNQYLTQNTYRITDLKPGQYTLTITSLDADSCKSSKQFSITESSVNPNTTSLYPNPTNGNVTVGICNLQPTPANYIIFSSSGKIVMQGAIIGINGMLPFNITTLPPGVYVLNVIIDGRKLDYKIIKL